MDFNIYVPDYLGQVAKDKYNGKLSAIFQEAIRRQLKLDANPSMKDKPNPIFFIRDRCTVMERLPDGRLKLVAIAASQHEAKHICKAMNGA